MLTYLALTYLLLAEEMMTVFEIAPVFETPDSYSSKVSM